MAMANGQLVENCGVALRIAVGRRFGRVLSILFVGRVPGSYVDRSGGSVPTGGSVAALLFPSYLRTASESWCDWL